MRKNCIFLVTISASLLLFSCLDSLFVTLVPEEFCDDAFVDCGPNGTTSFVDVPGAAFCSCVCDSDDDRFENKVSTIEEGGGIITSCICNEDLPCEEGSLYKRVLDEECQCYLSFLSLQKDPPTQVNNKALENDYFPLVLHQSYVYNTLNNEGTPNGTFGYLIVDTTLVHFLDDSLLLAIPTTLYHQGYFVFDSSGMITDTIPGSSFHNQPEDPNFVILRNSGGESILGLHQPTFGDSIGNEEDGYIFFDNIGMVTVPAGTFDNCFLLSADHVNGYVFAPNVGLIKITTEGKDAIVLVEFNGESSGQECEDILNISDPITDNTALNASDHIIISSEVQGSYDLTLQAANFIQLNPGFSVHLGAVVTALIAVCENVFEETNKK